jgi:hypothetical protein
MQTFLPYGNPSLSAQVLDNKRLGKQRVEAIQIARKLMGLSPGKGWTNHPAVKMWRGYEPYLVKVYLRAIMDEWIDRGYNNIKCEDHYKQLSAMLDSDPAKPKWFTEALFESHRSNLIRKLPDHYEPLFPGTPRNLEYVWPVE